MVSLFREQNLLTNKYWTERCASPCLSVLGKNKLCTAPDSHVAKVQICRVFWEKYYLFNCFLFICMGDLKESQNKHEKAMISTSFFSSKSKPNWHQIEILHNFNLPDTQLLGGFPTMLRRPPAITESTRRNPNTSLRIFPKHNLNHNFMFMNLS